VRQYNTLIEGLIEALRCLPGVGPKSARRMAFYLLERNREGAERLARALLEAVSGVRHCQRCRNLSDGPLCRICAGGKRDCTLLCVVENPADVESIEQAAVYQGRYFVLMGRLSPLDGIGPQSIGVDNLCQLLDGGEIREVIIATSATAEGEATAHFLGELMRGYGIRVTRIAHGIPVGGELEYIDSGTLSHAIACRREMS
jgi:recombination protein RecR